MYDEMNTPRIPRMETIKNTAKLCHVPEYFVRQKVLRGEVVAVCAGRKYLVNIDKFIEYLNTNTTPDPEELENIANSDNSDSKTETERPKAYKGITPVPVKLPPIRY